MSDFDMHDETYKWFDVAKDCHPLLTTDEPESNNVIAWAKTYKGARVVYIQSGHGHFGLREPQLPANPPAGDTVGGKREVISQ